MEFSGQYLTYEEYKALGGTLDLTPFNLLEFEAKNLIDLRTQNRLIDIKEIPQKVKICAFHLIEKINSYAENIYKINNNNKASESIDGYSVSYITPEKIINIIKTKHSELDDIMLTDLFGVVVDNVAILFNGVL